MLRKTPISNGALNVHDAGHGAPILFVHGFPLDHTMWRAQLDVFSQSHRVIAPDLRGFGQSAAAGPQAGTIDAVRPLTMEGHADDLADLLDALEVHVPIVYCALSMGGYVGWQFLRKYPERVRALIQCDTRSSADNDMAAEVRRKMAAQVMDRGSTMVAEQMPTKLFAPETMTDRLPVVEEVKRMILNTPAATIAAAQLGMAERPEMGDWLKTIRVPTLLVCGEHDALTTVEMMQADAARIPGSRLVIIPRAGHMAPMECPDAVNAAMREFLAGL
jgi:pimeloyl-ACP methyl ester carboxylesterase